jgi:hypothetical protein
MRPQVDVVRFNRKLLGWQKETAKGLPSYRDIQRSLADRY